MAINAKINGYVAQGATALGTAEAVAQLFGVSITDALGLNSQTNRVQNTTGGFNIQNFRSQLTQVGVMKPTLFLTEFRIPKILTSVYTTTGSEQKNVLRDTLLYTDGLSLPGVSWLTSDNIRHYGYGPMDSRPYGAQFGDINFSYIVDGRGEIFKFFSNWTNSIVNFNRSKGMNSLAVTGSRPYEVTYKDDYVTEMKIYVYDEASNRIMTCTLLEAYPLSIDPIQLNWASVDELARLPITFRFTDWYTDSVEFAQIADGFSYGLSFFQKLLKGVTAAQTLASLTKPNSIGDIINVVNNASIISDNIGDIF